MINFDVAYFNERRSEEVISFFWYSMYMSYPNAGFCVEKYVFEMFKCVTSLLHVQQDCFGAYRGEVGGVSFFFIPVLFSVAPNDLQIAQRSSTLHKKDLSCHLPVCH